MILDILLLTKRRRCVSSQAEGATERREAPSVREEPPEEARLPMYAAYPANPASTNWMFKIYHEVYVYLDYHSFVVLAMHLYGRTSLKCSMKLCGK